VDKETLKKVSIRIAIAVICTILTVGIIISDFNGKRAATDKMYKNAAFHAGDPIIVEASGQGGYVTEVNCDWLKPACRYMVSVFDGMRNYNDYLYEFELRKRQ